MGPPRGAGTYPGGPSPDMSSTPLPDRTNEPAHREGAGRPSIGALLVGLVVGTALFRVGLAGSKSLVLDEFHTWFHATRTDFAAFFEALCEDNHPPLSFLVVGVARTDTGFHVTQLFVSLAGTLDEDLLVQLEPGKTIESTATLDGWDDYRFALQTEETPIDLKSGKLPRDISGDVTLNVRAEKSVDEKSGNGTLERL